MCIIAEGHHPQYNECSLQKAFVRSYLGVYMMFLFRQKSEQEMRAHRENSFTFLPNFLLSCILLGKYELGSSGTINAYDGAFFVGMDFQSSFIIGG